MSGTRAHGAPLSCDEVRDLAPGFVLDSLADAEASAVRDHLATCDQAHDEILELASGLPALWDEIEPVEPPPALKDRIMAAAAAEPRDRARADLAPAEPVSLGRARATRRVVTFPRRLAAVAALAAVLVVAALGAWNVGLQSRVSALQARQDALAAVVSAASGPGVRLVVIAPAAAGGPGGLAAVDAGGGMRLAVVDLASVGSDVYTAWAIPAGQAPADIGSFAAGADGIGTLSLAGPLPSGEMTIAITREPKAGLAAPTGPIVAAGKASAGS